MKLYLALFAVSSAEKEPEEERGIYYTDYGIPPTYPPIYEQPNDGYGTGYDTGYDTGYNTGYATGYGNEYGTGYEGGYYDGKASVAGSALAGHQGNRRFCHETPKELIIRKWDTTGQGYFNIDNYRPVECFGMDMFCYIEERAQFGQIVNIQAGCAQMMNHPKSTTVQQTDIQVPYLKPYYNKEAARGDTVMFYYGIGGCLALPAQNGYNSNSQEFKENMIDNTWMGLHGGYGQNQCLRFHETEGPKAQLKLGTSTCRACCLATGGYYQTSYTGTTSENYVCNHLPDIDTTNQRPKIPDFDCVAKGCKKQIFPNFGMEEVPLYDAYYNLFQMPNTGSFCDTATQAGGQNCIPE